LSQFLGSKNEGVFEKKIHSFVLPFDLLYCTILTPETEYIASVRNNGR